MNYHRLLITTFNKSYRIFPRMRCQHPLASVYTFKEALTFTPGNCCKPAKVENQHYALKLDLMPQARLRPPEFPVRSVLTGQPGAEATAKLLLSFGVGGPGGRPDVCIDESTVAITSITLRLL